MELDPQKIHLQVYKYWLNYWGSSHLNRWIKQQILGKHSISKWYNTFCGLANFLSKNPLDLKYVARDNGNCKIVLHMEWYIDNIILKSRKGKKFEWFLILFGKFYFLLWNMDTLQPTKPGQNQGCACNLEVAVCM